MNDLISRQAAIDALDGKIEITGRTNAEAVKGYVRLVKDRLERLPSARPEPIKINIEDFNKEDWERLKKEWGNTPITVLPSAQPERKTEDFEKGLHDMFDHIWNCEIEHPMFQDTVGELMQAVIQLYRRVVRPCEEGEQDGNQEEGS